MFCLWTIRFRAYKWLFVIWSSFLLPFRCNYFPLVTVSVLLISPKFAYSGVPNSSPYVSVPVHFTFLSISTQLLFTCISCLYLCCLLTGLFLLCTPFKFPCLALFFWCCLIKTFSVKKKQIVISHNLWLIICCQI